MQSNSKAAEFIKELVAKHGDQLATDSRTRVAFEKALKDEWNMDIDLSGVVDTQGLAQALYTPLELATHNFKTNTGWYSADDMRKALDA